MTSARLRRQLRPHMRLNSIEEDDLSTETPGSRINTDHQQRNYVAGED